MKSEILSIRVKNIHVNARGVDAMNSINQAKTHSRMLGGARTVKVMKSVGEAKIYWVDKMLAEQAKEIPNSSAPVVA